MVEFKNGVWEVNGTYFYSFAPQAYLRAEMLEIDNTIDQLYQFSNEQIYKIVASATERAGIPIAKMKKIAGYWMGRGKA